MKIFFKDEELGSFTWELPVNFVGSLKKRGALANKFLQKRGQRPEFEKVVAQEITKNIILLLLAIMAIHSNGSKSPKEQKKGFLQFRRDLNRLMNNAEKACE